MGRYTAKITRPTWLGFALLCIGSVLIPLMMLALVAVHPALGQADLDMTLAGLVMISLNAVVAGALILILERKYARRQRE